LQKQHLKLIKMYITSFSKKASRNHNTVQFEIHSIESFLEEMTEGNPLLIFDNSYSMIWIEQGFGKMSIDL
jgi:hypothetical protein